MVEIIAEVTVDPVSASEVRVLRAGLDYLGQYLTDVAVMALGVNICKIQSGASVIKTVTRYRAFKPDAKTAQIEFRDTSMESYTFDTLIFVFEVLIGVDRTVASDLVKAIFSPAVTKRPEDVLIITLKLTFST